jgi:2-polyprenyl-6-methoxyphenol hydroxylase-like FAD-dependent oxidoreductase
MPEREVLETDVLIIGAGAAGLACAIHIHDLVHQHNSLHPERRVE